jgi:tetratricopeptide (TPR) repeat protein
MLNWNRLLWSLWAALLGLSLAGCSMSEDSPQEDEKEPHFELGKSRFSAMDYAGAAEAFKEALEVNPHSAAAHYQLACLYDSDTNASPGELSDPAAAIFHYQEYLRLDPGAENAAIIWQRIYSCKIRLANDVTALPSSPAAQQQLGILIEQNHQMKDELDKWHAYYAAEMAGRLNQGPAPTSAEPGSGIPTAVNPAGTHPPAAGGSGAPVAPIHLQTHTVARGDTLASIARKAGVSLPALQAANPGLNPRHLRTGETINLPPP